MKTNPDDKSNISELDYFKTPAIVDKELWDEVQIKLSNRKVYKMTSAQFEILYMVLIMRKSNEEKLGDDYQFEN